jgi:hypothetical protein
MALERLHVKRLAAKAGGVEELAAAVVPKQLGWSKQLR